MTASHRLPDLLDLPNGQAPLLRLSDNGPAILFYHANGFAPEAYTPFLRELSRDHALSALPLRDLWPRYTPPRMGRSWADLGEDLVHALDALDIGPVFLVGHSQGAGSGIYAAAARPDLFRGLVLVEPAAVAPGLSRVLKYTPRPILRCAEPARSALRRRAIWPDHASAFADFRENRAYRRITDDNLANLVSAVTRETPDGVALRFSREAEARNYLSARNFLPLLDRVKIPLHVIKTKPSLFFSAEVEKLFKTRRPDVRFTRHPEWGHLLPLEAPDLTADSVRKAIKGMSAP